MLKLEVNDLKMRKIVRQFPRQVARAGEITLDRTAYEVRDAVQAMMKKVFDRPTRWTLNSLRVQRTRNHNMKSAVWFKEPDRMGAHYLAPEIHGGTRKSKGFERALGGMPMMPSRHAKLNAYGNLPAGLIKQILSVVKNEGAGTTRRKPRDYVLLKKRTGNLPPGIYQRTKTGVGFGGKTKKQLPFGEFQKGRRKGRFASVVKARGLRPVLIMGKSRQVRYTPRLPFYAIGRDVVRHSFGPKFMRELLRQVAPR